MRIVPEAALALASADRRPPRGDIFDQLVAVAERHLSTSPHELLEMGPGSNFVRYSALLTELSLLAEIADDDRYLAHLRLVVDSLNDDGWRAGRFFDDHIQLPFVLGALAIAVDLVGTILSPDERRRWLVTVDAMAGHLHGQLSTKRWGSLERRVWNHNIIGYAALGLAASVVDGPEADAWLDLAIERSRLFLEEGVTPAGMTWEGISYCGFVFKLLGPFLNALELRGRRSEVCPPAMDQRLRGIPAWYAHSMFPRGSFVQNFNDSHAHPNAALEGFLVTFARDQPDLCGLVWQRLVGSGGLRNFGHHGRCSSLAEAMLFAPPEPYDPAALEVLDLVYRCGDVGFVSARDSWAAEASVLQFNGGPFMAELHDQSDNNSFTYMARGEPLVIDSGEGNRRVEDSASSSIGHNLVFVDGRAEQVSGQGYGVSGTITSVQRTEHAVIVSGDATDSYCQDGYNPVDHAVRHAAFVSGEVPYLVTFDDITKDDEQHDYEYVLHVPAVSGSDDALVDSISIVSGAREVGRVQVLNPPSVSMSVHGFSSRGRPYPLHSVVRLATRAIEPNFVMLFLPALAGPAYPECAVEVGAALVTVRLSWPARVDELTFPVRGRGARAVEQPPAHVRRPVGS